MAVGNPIVLSVSPQPDATSVVLKPVIQVAFIGPSLIDTLTWTSGTFALYGPGDVSYESGPGTILNSGIITDPYTLIDGAVIREAIPGTFKIYSSGYPPASGIISSGNIGVSGTVIYAEFTPNEPLNAYTQYTAVLVGEDAEIWSITENTFLGVASWSSKPLFDTNSISGIARVLTSYSRTLPTSSWVSGTGYNDTFRISITSGSVDGAPKFFWSQDSTGGTYASDGASPHNLGEGLTFEFSGIVSSGDTFSLDTYIPKALLKSYAWSFTTSTISGSTPPADVVSPDLIIDMTPDGGMAPVSETNVPLQLVATWPEDLAYGVRPDLPLIMLEFNKPLVSGSLDITKFQIRCTPLLSLPNVSGTGLISPQIIEYSGVYLKLWL